MFSSIAMNEFTHEILQPVNNKIQVSGIFYDLAKALDYINHKIILAYFHHILQTEDRGLE
jgi:hypothetical protein